MNPITDITKFIFLENPPEKADIIFIPGGSYPEIGEKASELWIKGYAPLVLPSGKYSVNLGYFPGPSSKKEIYTDTYKTEWDFFRKILLANGVCEDVILREDNAEFTYENAIKSLEITNMLGLNVKKAIICCKSYHARRCFMYYKMVYPDTEFLICPSDVKNITKDTWFTTEKGINTVMGELMKCGSQFKDYISLFCT